MSHNTWRCTVESNARHVFIHDAMTSEFVMGTIITFGQRTSIFICSPNGMRFHTVFIHRSHIWKRKTQPNYVFVPRYRYKNTWHVIYIVSSEWPFYSLHHGWSNFGSIDYEKKVLFILNKLKHFSPSPKRMIREKGHRLK